MRRRHGGGFVPERVFFSAWKTLATVGYGHMYPATIYAHLVTTVEIMVGMFGTAVMTGLIFVRFSRPAARLLFSRVLVLTTFDGQPALMLRVANERRQSMVRAEFRLMLARHEPTREDPTMYRFHALPLQINHMVVFPAAITIRHLIDERSPLHGATPESLKKTGTRFMASVECMDKVIQAPVQSESLYSADDVRFGEQFVEIYGDDENGPPQGRLQPSARHRAGRRGVTGLRRVAGDPSRDVCGRCTCCFNTEDTEEHRDRRRSEAKKKRQTPDGIPEPLSSCHLSCLSFLFSSGLCGPPCPPCKNNTSPPHRASPTRNPPLTTSPPAAVSWARPP